MNRAEHLKKDENCAGKRERTRKGITAFDRPDKNAHGNGERRRKSAPQQQGQPPCQGKARSGPGQDGEKPPFLAFEHPLEHARIVPEKPFLCINRWLKGVGVRVIWDFTGRVRLRSEEHTSELQSRLHLVCRLLLEKKKNIEF